MNICVLGRQPELGLAELESLYGGDHVRAAGDSCAFVDAKVDFARLGGSVKLATVLATIPGDIRQAFKQLSPSIIRLAKELPEGKIKLGMSLYGFSMKPFDINGEGLRLKHLLKKQGHSVRLVPSKDTALSSAQTYHNSLTTDLGVELIFVKDGDSTVVGRVTEVQNIDAYRIRDRERPKRDAFVGMLPPKLAQIIINLAASRTSVENAVVLDPFCGTGVVLQEAALMGFRLYGSDLQERMVRATRDNIGWLEDKRRAHYEVMYETADATEHIWCAPVNIIATETYLGQPLGGQHPTKEKMTEIVHDTNRIVKGFLKNIAPQLTSGTRLCLAVPAWFVDSTQRRLPVVDELDELGFALHTFDHVVTPLIYHRENQVTGRELLVLIKE